MTYKTVTLLVAASLAGVFCAVAPAPRGLELRADPVEPFRDSDFDFLSDDVEWAVLTDAQRADTDTDGVSDFVEVVQRGAPRCGGDPRPYDHEMRVIVTATGAGATQQAWLHLLFRFMDAPTSMTSFQPWLELGAYPGLRLPLDSLAVGGVVYRERLVPTEGQWVSISLPMASEAALRLLLPCTIVAEATFGSRVIRNGVQLFDLAGSTATLVPWNEGVAMQTLVPVPPSSSAEPNRICVLRLQPVAVTPGGTALQVVRADCEDCNDLECGASCAQSVGWVFVVPGGLGVITGGG